MLKINIDNLDLDNTITCGQIFRFIKEEDKSYTVILSDRVVNLKLVGDILYVDSNNSNDLENVIKTYLDLDRNYFDIIEKLKKSDIKLSNYLDYSYGLKMIKQKPLECVISYIISANNSVRNITNSLNLISEKFGEKVVFKNREYYLFPTLKKLHQITEEQFRECKVGFRAKYLVEIIKEINRGNLVLEKINALSTEEAIDYLIYFKGIGMKVASCILLFAYHKFDVFPIDTWVKKFMKKVYNIESEESIRKYAKETYKEYCGLAIQYMFNSERN